jgi:hypothetical protein
MEKCGNFLCSEKIKDQWVCTCYFDEQWGTTDENQWLPKSTRYCDTFFGITETNILTSISISGDVIDFTYYKEEFKKTITISSINSPYSLIGDELLFAPSGDFLIPSNFEYKMEFNR